jgi:hypothetical protein
MGSKGDDDKTDPFNQGNISRPTSVEELKQQLEAKFNAVLKAFLESCTKDRRDKVTQYKEPDFSGLVAATSSTTLAAPEDKVNDEVPDPYPTRANYSKMLQDQWNIYHR